MATYGPGIDQSQHTKSVSHIINLLTYWYMNCINQLMFYLTVYYFINKVAFLKLHHSAIQVYEYLTAPTPPIAALSPCVC